MRQPVFWTVRGGWQRTEVATSFPRCLKVMQAKTYVRDVFHKKTAKNENKKTDQDRSIVFLVFGTLQAFTVLMKGSFKEKE